MEFHEKLQELRKQKELTQEELAQQLFVSRTAVSKWESGRGYPNIESLKAISKYFGVTVDELLSGEELLTVAEEDTRQKQCRVRTMVFGLLDCSTLLFLFLPLFADRSGQAVSLLGLTDLALYMRILYFIAVAGSVGAGVATFFIKSGKLSCAMNVLAVLLFTLSPQPYAAVLLFVFLVIKAVMTRTVSHR